MGNELERGTNKSRTLIPFIYKCTMLPTKTFSKILRENLLIQYSHSNWHLTFFHVCITARVICPTAELLVDSGYQELN